MKCPFCETYLISLYYRDNRDGSRSWVKTKELYCKKCKKIFNSK